MSARAAEVARTWLGTPYRHQASLRGEGADCLGLVRGVWRELVGREPEPTPAYQADWAEVGGEETLLAAATGADGLLIGSEMRGLTWTRDADGGFPAVDQFKALAAECRAIAGPAAAISYAADWSEYFGRHDGADVVFHLDPLWADPNIDYVGIDWYPPLGDWRADDGGVEGETFAGPDDPAYLAAQVAGGEGFDWFYASAADRAAQSRTPIADTAHGEDWVFRPKDLKGWAACCAASRERRPPWSRGRPRARS